MPSLRKRVSSYFRQLSFHNEPREKRHNVNENTFVTKYLQGFIALREGPPIIYGKNPTDLPNYEIGLYESGPNTITGCYSGPHGGLTTVKRTEKHLSMLDADIDFIDTHDEETVPSSLPKKSPHKLYPGQPIDNTTMVIKVAGHEYCVTNRSRRHSKSHSLGSISDFNIEIEKTKIEKSFYSTNNNCESIECKNNLALLQYDVESKPENAEELNQNNRLSVKDDLTGTTCDSTSELKPNEDGRLNSTENSGDRRNRVKINDGNSKTNQTASKGKENKTADVSFVLTPQNKNVSDKTESQSYGLSKSKSEGNPFHHKKRGRIIKIDRPNARGKQSKAWRIR